LYKVKEFFIFPRVINFAGQYLRLAQTGMSAAHSEKRGRDAPRYGIMHVGKFRRVLAQKESGRYLTAWFLLSCQVTFPPPKRGGQDPTEQDFAAQH